MGVALTCRWIAHSRGTTLNGVTGPARAPVTERTRLAYEELIEAEYLAAEKLDLRQPRPAWLVKRPGWVEGVCATLRWVWRAPDRRRFRATEGSGPLADRPALAGRSLVITETARSADRERFALGGAVAFLLGALVVAVPPAQLLSPLTG